MKSNTNWQPLIELIVVLMTIVGSTVPLYIHMDNKTTQLLQEIRQDRKEFNEMWNKEMRDYHGRLCAIEERRGK